MPTKKQTSLTLLMTLILPSRPILNNGYVPDPPDPLFFAPTPPAHKLLPSAAQAMPTRFDQPLTSTGLSEPSAIRKI